MAFQQYNSAAYKKRQEEYEKRLAEKISRREDKRQKRDGFSLYNLKDHLKEDYDPKTSMGNRGQDKKRTGSIYTDEPPGDDRMSPALKEVFFRPIKADRIDPDKVMKNKTRKKHTPSSARGIADGRRRTAKIYGKKKKKTVTRGGRRRKKQRGGETPLCQTTQFTYEQLENREGETFHVKAPETDFMNDGNYILQDYGIDGQGGEGAGIGLVGVSGGANGDFHVDATDISGNRVRICKLDDGSEEKRQAGGLRKRRRKTRKNKRSKKKRGKKRKTRKRRKKRR